MSEVSEGIRSFWDIDSETYDNSTGHRPRTAIELAAWSAAIRRLLPPPPAQVLDVGAGTGFLSLLLAQQGYRVTALDLAPRMLARLHDKATQAGLAVRTIEGDASVPPKENFDAVVERHVLWTLPDPAAALDAWHDAAPTGRLVLFESEWGRAGGRAGQIRAAARHSLRRLRQEQPDHHGEYHPEVRALLPLGTGPTAEKLVSLVGASTWGAARIERLRDVDWATRQALPTTIDKIIGVSPRFAIVAG